MMQSKKQLAVELGKYKVFNEPSAQSEQYPTDPEIAAEVLWFACMQGDVRGKIIADLGAGSGVLGIGCLLLGAKKVHFVEQEDKVMPILDENVHTWSEQAIIRHMDVREFAEPVDVVFQNPPFGVQKRHADKVFLEKAFSLAGTIYTFHKLATENFVRAISKEHHFAITHRFAFSFPLKQSMEHHKKKVKHIRVGCWRLELIQ